MGYQPPPAAPTTDWEILGRRGIAPPATLEQGEERLALLQGEVLLIQGQLAANRPVGRLPARDFEEYQAWKRKAAWALQAKNAEIAALRRWCQRERERPKPPNLSDRRHLRRCLYHLRLLADHLDEEGRAILEAAERHLQDGDEEEGSS
jgi:hypothetical protein